MPDTEVEITNEGSKAVIEGKTAVPFKTFVSLILQRKVQTLFKKCQDEPVIVNGELLTALASAPDDKQEDRSILVLVTLGAGMLFGIFCSIAGFLGLMLLDIHPEKKDLIIALGVLALVAVVIMLLQRTQKKSGFKEKLYESMEKVADLVTR